MRPKELTLAVVIGLLLTSAAASASPEDDALAALMADYWEVEVRASPLSATMFGESRFADLVDDVSLDAFAARAERFDAALQDLAGIDQSGLSEHSLEQYQVFEWMLQGERRNLDFETSYFNITSTGGWHTGFPQIILARSYASEEDYEDLLKRLAAFGTYARQNMALMRRGLETGYTQPCESLAGYEQTISGYMSENPADSFFAQPFATMPASIGPARQQELRSEALSVIDAVINPAYRAFAKFFRQTYRPACRTQAGISALPNGREAYDQALRYYTSLDTDARSVHALGLKEVGRIREEMNRIIAEVGFAGGFAEFLEFLRTDPQFYSADEASYLRHVAWIAKSIDSRLPSYFAKLPRNPYGISVIPEQIAAKSTTAYYQPGAADGTRSGQYFVNTHDLSARPLYELPALTLHESVPGHHLQISFQGENTDLPEWRRYYYFHAFGEGWGLYAEYLGEEMDIYTTPYERFGRLIFEMWRAVRLVVDTGIHAFDWSRERAINYMLANTGLARANVVAEIDRYMTWPGQATAYKHGELKIKELRRRAENALQGDFDLREFHLHLVSGGSLPLSVLDTRMQRWIDAKAVATAGDAATVRESPGHVYK